MTIIFSSIIVPFCCTANPYPIFERPAFGHGWVDITFIDNLCYFYLYMMGYPYPLIIPKGGG